MTYFAASIAKPVVNGWMSFDVAHASIVSVIAKGMRENTLDGTGTLAERIDIDRHILDLNIAALEARKQSATGVITRMLRPLIGIGAPSNRLLAEAHNSNEDLGFPLSEAEVTETVALQIFHAAQKKAVA